MWDVTYCFFTPPLLTDSLIGHRTLVAGLPDSGVQVCPARAYLQYCT